MGKNKHLTKRLLVLFVTMAFFMNGFMLYAKEPDNSTELPATSAEQPDNSTELHNTTTEETPSITETSVSTEDVTHNQEQHSAEKTATITPASTQSVKNVSASTQESNSLAKIVRDGEAIYYTDLGTALSRSIEGEEIILLQDVPAAVRYYTIDKSITLNLNGHSIDGVKNYTFVINKYNTSGITVTIKDGAIYNSCKKDYDSMSICMPIYIRSCGNVKLENVTLEARPDIDITSTGLRIVKNATKTNGSVPQVHINGKNSFIKGTTSGINVISDMENDVSPELIINGGTISGGSFGIAGNGMNDTTSIVINDGTVKALDSDGTAIYHPQDGELTVTGGTIEGKNGIQFCGAGKLLISGGTITATADSIDNIPPDDYNGTVMDGAALSVLSRGGAYGAAKSLDVSITGGTLKSINNTAFRESSADSQETLIKSLSIAPGNNKELKVIAGDKKTAISFQNLSGPDAKVISGGRFSSIIPNDFCADEYECEI